MPFLLCEKKHKSSLSYYSFFLYSSFAAPLGYFLFNCGIFIKLSINQIGLLQSPKIIIWYEKLSWYKKVSFGINICSYLIRSFQNFLEEVLTHSFFTYRSWFEDFLHLHIGDGSGLPCKYSTYQWCSRDRNLRDRDLAQISRRDRDFVIKAETETETWKFETETSHFSNGN